MSTGVGPEDLPIRVPASGERFGGGVIPDYTVLTPEQELRGDVQNLYERGDLAGLTLVAGGALLPYMRPTLDRHYEAGGDLAEILDFLQQAAAGHRTKVLSELERNPRRRITFPQSVIDALVLEGAPDPASDQVREEELRNRLSNLGKASEGRRRAEEEDKEQ